MIRAIHHVQLSIPVGSEDEARRFYCGLLGFIEVPKPDSLVGRGGFWMQLGALQIHVGTEDGVDRTRTKSHVAYLVDDLEHWRDRLLSNNIESINGIPIPGYDRFEFRDPFGNRVEFLQEKR
jgi:catechol 2,3-dioxygenase-like lactoylglutathione lyase family enzyme